MSEPDEPVEGLSDDDLDELDPDDEIGGDAAPHPVFTFPRILVGPATDGQANTIEEWIRPIACWRLDDTRFEFDSSFVKPGSAREFKLLEETRDENPGATLSIFGHADPTGDDDYNKTLSGRRARAIYGMLTRNAEMWEELFSKRTPGGGDPWGNPALETMLVTTGRDPAGAANLSKDQRAELYRAYMERLCGPRLSLDPTKDFLARGTGDQLRGDIEGCSEFNAVLRFSKKEDAEFSQFKNKTRRDSENVPNRRVVAYLFRKELEIDPNQWPCPSSSAGPGQCRNRFWVDHQKRKAPDEERREFAKDKDTFQCRFYHRLAIQSPCEESVVTSLQKIRVRLRLVYRDPVDPSIERPFPKGFEVEAVCEDGTSRKTRVRDDGLVRFVLERSKLSFILDFNSTDQPYFANARPNSKATPENKLVSEEQHEASALEGFRMFKVPAVWSTTDTDWPVVESPLFKEGRFSGIDNPAATIGTPSSPVKMVLDPHWQILRYEYFDRFLSKTFPVPPMFVQGFQLSELAFGSPDTRSNWTSDEGNQCLPWILRDLKTPNKDCLVEVELVGQRFIEAKQDGSRRIVALSSTIGEPTVQPDLVDKPSAERLRFYDLPERWRSKGYFARLGGSKDFFEKLADQATSNGKPLTFSLDDIVFANQTGLIVTPIAWDPKTDRIATFSHKVHEGIDKGLFQPESNDPWLSQKPTTITDRNYLVDHPDWTRFIIMRGRIFDTFNARINDPQASALGARAASLTLDSTQGTGPPSAAPSSTFDAPFTSVEIGFDQNHPNRGSIGRGDFAIFRCCDRQGDDEMAVQIHYYRLHFNFGSSPIRTTIEGERTTKPPTLSAGQQDGFVRTGIENVHKRWNGPKGDFDRKNAELQPASGGPKLKTPVLWFAQAFPQPLSAGTAALKNNELQYFICIFEEVRGFMSSRRGLGAIDQTENKPTSSGSNKGRFTFAHELGHGDSLEDEYIESANNCSYFQPGYEDFIPGSPYSDDSNGMMEGNRIPRPRHYWHAAEWMRKRFTNEFLVRHDEFLFRVPPHAGGPQKTHVTDPWSEARNTGANSGFCDLYLFRLGIEDFSFRVLNEGQGETAGPFDGLISVEVRMRLTFPHTNHNKLVSQTGKILRGIRKRLNGKFVVTGTEKGEKFDRCALWFSPRFLVDSDSGDDDYHKSCKVTATKNYGQRVNDVEAEFGTHYTVRLTESGPSTIVRGAGSKGSATFNMDDTDDLEDKFPVFFAQMLGVPAAGIDTASSYDPLVAAVITTNAKVQRL